jgi:hypothetical protein
MYIQPCTSKSLARGATLNFSSKNSSDYYSYISEKSGDIIIISALAGSSIGFMSAKNNLQDELLPKAFHSVGIVALALFGLASLNFFMAETRHSRENN